VIQDAESALPDENHLHDVTDKSATHEDGWVDVGLDSD
jgi:hypothetical protein